MKKYIGFIIFLALSLFLQSTDFYDEFSIRSVSPDFLLIFIALAGFITGPLPGVITGFLTGIISDIFSGGLLGLSAFAYTVAGYLSGLAGARIYGRNIIVAVLLLFVMTVVKALLLSMFAALFLEPGYFGLFSQGRVFLQAVMNCVLTPLLYYIIMKIEDKISE